MAEITDTVQVAIRRETVYPTGPGFGTACLLVLHTYWASLARRFSSLKELTDAGVGLGSRLYLLAQKHLSQNPSVSYFVVGKRALAYTQIFQIVPKVATEGYVYLFNVIETAETGPATTTQIEYTVPAAATLDAIATALAALFPAAIGAAVAATGTITYTMQAGKFAILDALPPITEMTVKDTSADPGIATDMAAVQAEAALDVSKSFFAWTIDRTSKAEALAVSAYIEATKTVGIVESSDSEISDGVITNDVASSMKTAAYAQTIGIFAQYGTGTFRAAAWLGSQLPYPVGSNTWAYKTLNGVPADKMQSGEASTVEGKNWSTYRPMGAAGGTTVNVTFESKTPSGEFFDTIVGQLELESALQVACFGQFVNRPKIPFTDAGIAVLTSQVRKVISDRTCKTADDLKYFAADPAPIVTAPKAADISDANKAARILDPPITFSAKISGGIHRVKVSGTIGV